MQGHLWGNYSSRHHILPCDDFLVPLKKHIPPRLLGSDILRHLLLEIKSSGCKIPAIMVRTLFSQDFVDLLGRQLSSGFILS